MTVAVPLLYQQRGYEKPAEHEEDVDAEEPAKPVGNVGMGNHHREHGPGPKPVEGLDMGEAPTWFR